MNILIVDDDPMMIKTLSDIMKLQGYEADDATSGKEALSKLKDKEFHCVISDIKMSGMSGLELYRIIKENFSHIPVILMSAYSSENIIEEALSEGVITVLTKPLDINLILNFLFFLQKEKTVAIIDDDPIFSSALEHLLKIRNYNITMTNDPENLFDVITDRTDVVLLDMNLGGTDGLQLFIKIREKFPLLPVILITGFGEVMFEKIEKAITAGVFGCFYKPFSIKELSESLLNIRNNELIRFFRRKG